MITDVLTLERPIVFYDTETTGPDSEEDRIVQIGLVHVSPDGSTRRWKTLVNPERPIPYQASHGNGTTYPGHGITDERVQGCSICLKPRGVCTAALQPDHLFKPWPTFRDLARGLLKGFTGVDFAGFNVAKFDLPLTDAEFRRVGLVWEWYAEARVLDGMRLWQLGAPRTLGDAAEVFLKRPISDAHDALADVDTSHDVIVAQLLKWPDRIPRDLSVIHDLSWPMEENALDPGNKFLWEDGEVVVNFGKNWKGTKLVMMKRKDLIWIATKMRGLNPVARRIALDAAQGVYPDRVPLDTDRTPDLSSAPVGGTADDERSRTGDHLRAPDAGWLPLGLPESDGHP